MKTAVTRGVLEVAGAFLAAFMISLSQGIDWRKAALAGLGMAGYALKAYLTPSPSQIKKETTV